MIALSLVHTILVMFLLYISLYLFLKKAPAKAFLWKRQADRGKKKPQDLSLPLHMH